MQNCIKINKKTDPNLIFITYLHIYFCTSVSRSRFALSVISLLQNSLVYLYIFRCEHVEPVVEIKLFHWLMADQ